MSRREEVDKKLEDISWANDDYEGDWNAVLPLARTLADEVDARDRVISALLLAMKPGEQPKPEQYDGYDQLFRERLCRWNDSNKRYARACEIAGRVK